MIRTACLAALTAAFASLPFRAPAEPAPAQALPSVGGYAIVAEQAVLDDPQWKEVTDALLAKYPQAKVYAFGKSPEEVREALASELPQYTAVVVRPGTATDLFVLDLHNLFRRLDGDPWCDTLWSIVTGYDAEAARVLAAAEPIAVRKGLDCAGTDITAFEEAWFYTETARGTLKHWKRGAMAEPEAVPCDTDNTQGFLERLQRDRVQFLATSGHATERNWDMGYCGPNLWLSHDRGRLIAIDTRRKPFFADNPEPKVYIAAGNCLIGHIDRPDCMATAWMRDGGVRQMVGYVVTTWHGSMGWGTLGTYTGCSGLYTVAEAFHATNADILLRLKRIGEEQGIGDLLTYRMTELGETNLPMTPGIRDWAVRQSNAGLPYADGDPAAFSAKMRDIIGLVHDRDTVALYGDPALETRIAGGRAVPGPWMREPDGALTRTVTFSPDAPAKAFWLMLPGSYAYGKVSPEPAFACDNMLCFPADAVKPGASVTVRVEGARRLGE